MGADGLAHVQAVHPRHADIEQDQVVAVGGQVQKCPFATIHGLGLPAELLEDHWRHPAMDGVIIEDQDAVCRVHTPSFLQREKAHSSAPYHGGFLDYIGCDRTEHEPAAR
jgi:hypothetical protein